MDLNAELFALAIRHAFLKECVPSLRCASLKADPRAPLGADYVLWIQVPRWLDLDSAVAFYARLFNMAVLGSQVVKAEGQSVGEESSGDDLDGYETVRDQPWDKQGGSTDVKLFVSSPRYPERLLANAEWQLRFNDWLLRNPPDDEAWVERLLED